VGRKLLGFELENDVNGGGEEEEEEEQREMRERESGGRGSRASEGERRDAQITMLPLPTLFYLFGPSCSGIGVASLIRFLNSKFNGR